MKNERTPRTLAECEFTVDYPTLSPLEVGRRPLLWYVSRWVRMMLRRFG